MKAVFSRIIVFTVILSMQLALLAGCVEQGRSQIGLSLSYNVSKGATQNTVRVVMRAEHAQPGKTVRFYLSGNPVDLQWARNGHEQDIPVELGADYVDVTPDSEQFTVYYHISVGGREKHGHAGYADKKLLTASGAQLLLLPLYAFSVDEAEVRNAVRSIEVNMEGPEGRQTSAPAVLGDVTWNGVYQLLHSSFTMGTFETQTFTVGDSSLRICTQTDEQEQATERICKLYEALGQLFGGYPDTFELTLLDATQGGEYIMGGAGGYTMAATFDPTLQRDWELLIHRLFHAFFETVCDSYTPHMPGNLWLYEGLASLYELRLLPLVWEDAEYETEVARLYGQYLYLRLKYPEQLTFAAADEAELLNASDAKIEFLHYTMAPIIAAVEGEDDRLLKAFIDRANAGGEEIFAQELLVEPGLATGEDVILWEDVPGEMVSMEALITAEETLATWLQLEIPGFFYASPDIQHKAEITYFAESKGLSYGDASTEAWIFAHLPAVHDSLMHAALCRYFFEQSGEEMLTPEADAFSRWQLWLNKQLNQ